MEKINMDANEFWTLRRSHEKLAIDSGDVRQMVICAKTRLSFIATGITDSGRPNRLAYKEHLDHMNAAMRLLNAANSAERQIAKDERESQKDQKDETLIPLGGLHDDMGITCMESSDESDFPPR